MSEQTSINSGDILLNQQKIGELEDRIKQLEEGVPHLVLRLHKLEEKERERAREKHQIELTLDEISEPVPYVPPPENHEDKEGWRDR